MQNMLKNNVFSPCSVMLEILKHPVLIATSEVEFAHLLMHRIKEVAPVIKGREIMLANFILFTIGGFFYIRIVEMVCDF